MEAIKQARKAANLTQSQLAEKLGVSQAAVAQWENGLTHPSYSILRPLANVLNIPVDDLIEEVTDEAVNA